MPRPEPLRYGPFTKGLVTAPDATLLTENGFTVSASADITKGVIQGLYGPGDAVETLASAGGYLVRVLHYTSANEWVFSVTTNWFFDDASPTAQGTRITYRTNLLEDGSGIDHPTVIIGANEYRLGMDAPGSGATATTGTTGGSVSYAVTFYDPVTGIESNPTTIGTVTNWTGAVLGSIPRFPGVPADPDPGRTSVIRRLYVTQPGDPSGIKYQLVNATTLADPLNNNTTTSFTHTTAYGILEAAPLDWGDGGTIDNDVMPYDHRPPLRLTVLPNALHSVNEGQGNQGSGIMVAAMDNWLCWSMLGYPHYWPAVNQMRLEENVTCIFTVDAETFVFTEHMILSVSGVADYALSIVKTAASFGVKDGYARTMQKTPLGLVFFTDQGLAVFDGTQVRIITPQIDPYDLKSEVTYGAASGAYDQGFYFLTFATGRVYVFDLRDPENITVTVALVNAECFYVSHRTIDGVEAGLYALDFSQHVSPWRPLDRDLITGATRLPWEVRTGEHTQGVPTNKKRYNRIRIDGEGTLAVRFYLDGSTTASHTTTTKGQTWLPSGLTGSTLTIEAESTDGTGILRAVEVDTEVYG